MSRRGFLLNANRIVHNSRAAGARLLKVVCVALCAPWLFALLGGCDGGSSARRVDDALSVRPKALDALYAKVRASGETRVVVYSSTVDTEFEPLWLEFQKDYPELRVVYMMVASSQIMSRVAAERATGNIMGDVLMQTVDTLPELKRGGYLEPFVPPGIQALTPRLRDGEGYYHYALYKLYGLAYNTRLVKEGDLPQRFEELLDPRWRDHFTFVQPLGPVGNTDVALLTLLRDGIAKPEQLGPLRRAGSYSMPEAGISYVAQGRQQLSAWAYLPPLVRQRELGAPVAIKFVPDFSTRVPYGLALARSAPHPEAARLLIAWLFSERGQRALAERSYMQGSMPGAPLPAYISGDEASRLHEPSWPDELLAQMKQSRALLAEVFLKPK